MAEAGSVLENRANNIGQIFQAGEQLYHAAQQTFVYNAAASPSRAPLLASLRRLDRADQLEQLADAIADAREDRRGTPLVVVVEGIEEDDLSSFVQRIVEHEFEAEMLLPCDYLGFLDWPRRSFQRVISRLTSAIVHERKGTVPSTVAAQPTLVELIAAHDRSLAFTLSLDPELCQRQPELLRDWAALITGAYPNPCNGLLICFLCVQLRDPRRPSCRWIVDELGALSATHRWCRLDTLPRITPDELKKWINQYNYEPVLPEIAYIKPGVSEAVFGSERDLPYRRVFEAVLGMVDEQLRPQAPRWARS